METVCGRKGLRCIAVIPEWSCAQYSDLWSQLLIFSSMELEYPFGTLFGYQIAMRC